jgi:hypothetical protein
MNGTLTVIPADGGDIRITTLTRAPTLADLQAGIGGGYIETVPFFNNYEGKPCVAFCDEEGKMKRLPLNFRANELWRFGGFDWLAGDVIIVQGDDEFRAAL